MHLTKTEIILYATQFGLTESQRQDVEKHLLLCEECTEMHQQCANEIKKMVKENELECQSIEDDMADYLLDDISPKRKLEIEQHLEKCDSCRFTLNSLKNFSLEPAEAHIPGKISISNKLKRYLAELKDAFGTIANLTINPLPTAPVFLGKHTQPGLERISHNGGDICLNIQKPFQNVSLFSSEQMELKTLKSDEFGIVVFEDFLPGDYQVGIDGFEVKNVKYMS